MERINLRRALPANILQQIVEWAEVYADGVTHEIKLGQIWLDSKTELPRTEDEPTDAELQVFNTVINAVINEIPVSRKLITGNTREQPAIKCRQLAMFFIKKHTKMTHAKIGRMFGRDHSSVSHSLKAVLNYLATDIVFSEQFADIETSISDAL